MFRLCYSHRVTDDAKNIIVGHVFWNGIHLKNNSNTVSIRAEAPALDPLGADVRYALKRQVVNM